MLSLVKFLTNSSFATQHHSRGLPQCVLSIEQEIHNKLLFFPPPQGVPEVIVGDPNSGAIEILWLTSAVCKTDTKLVAQEESRCYFIQTYEENGLKARFSDLTGLILAEGHETSYVERGDARFKISVCRPLALGDAHPCTGSMACLMTGDSHFTVTSELPLPLVERGAEEDSSLHMEGDLLTVIYSKDGVDSCEHKQRSVKIHFLCPSGGEVSTRLAFFFTV